MAFWFSIAIAFLVGIPAWVLLLTVLSKMLRFRARANSYRWRIAQDLQNSRWSLAIGLAALSAVPGAILGTDMEAMFRHEAWILLGYLVVRMLIYAILWGVVITLLARFVRAGAGESTMRWRVGKKVNASRRVVALLLAPPTFWLMFFALSVREPSENMPEAACRLNQSRLFGAEPVTAEILALNSLRKAAGLYEVGADWLVVNLKPRRYSDLRHSILIDSKNRVSRIVETQTFRPATDRGEFLTEYTVVPGDFRPPYQLNWLQRLLRVDFLLPYERGIIQGPAMVCRGDPERGVPYKLFETERYVQNRRDGVKVFFAEDGSIIAAGEYLGHRCINGRELCRDHRGDPWAIADERNFRNGRPHGLFKRYPGVSPDKPEGKETWFFDGDNLGEGKDGEAAFRAREAAERRNQEQASPNGAGDHSFGTKHPRQHLRE